MNLIFTNHIYIGNVSINHATGSTSILINAWASYIISFKDNHLIVHWIFDWNIIESDEHSVERTMRIWTFSNIIDCFRPLKSAVEYLVFERIRGYTYSGCYLAPGPIFLRHAKYARHGRPTFHTVDNIYETS